MRLCLNSRFPILLWLGPELRLVYNDAYIPFLGEAKHPAMLGAPGREAWGEIWPTIGPMHDEVRAGRATWVEDMQLFFARRLPREEVYVTFSYSPIFGDDGRTVEGTLCVCTETTERVLGERRLSTLRGLGLLAPEQRTVEAACRHAADVLAANPADIPFAAIYVIDEGGRTGAPRCRHAAGRRPSRRSRVPNRSRDLGRASLGRSPRSCDRGQAVEVTDLARGVGLLRGPLWPDIVERAVVLPLPAPGQQRLRAFSSSASIPAASWTRAIGRSSTLRPSTSRRASRRRDAFQDERRRAEALAELDRAKTAFFSNVSHEFRTPLTLMMGPLEELLRKPAAELAGRCRALAAVAHRNSLRLLKLVNTLLDFSRIEAGRAEAVVRADRPCRAHGRAGVELPFGLRARRSSAPRRLPAAAAAGLRRPGHVGEGRPQPPLQRLQVHPRGRHHGAPGGDGARVPSCGSATPAAASPSAELPRLFERFHRIEGQQGRSFEGSGIGLALVQELVRLHGGSIAAESEVGRGTTFSVVLPFGYAHLPAERIGGRRAASPASHARRGLRRGGPALAVGR